MKEKELAPIKEPREYIEKIERLLIKLIFDEVYGPLLKLIKEPKRTLQNSTDDLLEAILSGRIQFNHGEFTGKFNATISKELKFQGAKWDRRRGSWKIQLKDLSIEVKNAISQSKYRLEQKLRLIDEKLAAINPEQLVSKLRISEILDQSLWDLDKQLHGQLKNITVLPKFNEHERQRIIKEYSTNMELDIKKWADESIMDLRKKVEENVTSGLRYSNLVPTIQERYGVSLSKARFLAEQETKLITTKFHEVRYDDAGIEYYFWQSVVGSPAHPVRDRHKYLNKQSEKGRQMLATGKYTKAELYARNEDLIQRLDKPPLCSDEGQNPRYAHAGADFRCRCKMRPVINFKEALSKK